MQPHGIGPVGRACRKDTGQRIASVVSRVNLEHVPLRLVEPGENPDLLARPDPVETSNEIRKDLDRRVGGPFETLLGGL